MRQAVKADANVQEFPAEAKQLKIEATYTEKEHGYIMLGFLHMQMEDKWFIYWEKDWVYFHRSWTGYPVFKVGFEKTNEGYKIKEAWVNRKPGLFNDLENAEDVMTLNFLINRILLCKHCEIPGDGKGAAAIQAFSEMGYARGNREESVEPFKVIKSNKPQEWESFEISAEYTNSEFDSIKKGCRPTDAGGFKIESTYDNDVLCFQDCRWGNSIYKVRFGKTSSGYRIISAMKASGYSYSYPDDALLKYFIDRSLLLKDTAFPDIWNRYGRDVK